MSTFGADAVFGDLISDGLAGLQSALSQYGSASVTNFGGAITALQAAGSAAVEVVGPAIDILSAGDAKVKAITQRVWQTNTQLSGLTGGDGALQSDWAYAVSTVRNMMSQYGEAYRLAKSYKVPALGQAAARAAGAPKIAAGAPKIAAGAPKIAAKKAVSTALAAVPTVAITPTKSPTLGEDANTMGAILGAVVGLTLGGAIGWSAGAKAGLVIGGPLGGAAGALAGYFLTQQLAAPSSVPTA